MPFLTCLLVASTHQGRQTSGSVEWGRTGNNSLYLALTANHTRVTRVMEEALAEKGCWQHFITPTIFNNVLWNAVVDREGDFLVAQYSLFDDVPVSFTPSPKDTTCSTTLTPTAPFRCCDGSALGTSMPSKKRRLPASERPSLWHIFRQGHGPDDYIFRFNLTDRVPTDYGFEQAQADRPTTPPRT